MSTTLYDYISREPGRDPEERQHKYCQLDRQKREREGQRETERDREG